MRKLTMIAVLTTAGFMGASAHAGTVYFGNGHLLADTDTSMSFTDGQVNITATADSTNTYEAAKVSQNLTGLGVDSGKAGQGLFPPSDWHTSQLNSNKFDETLWLTFDKTVQLDWVEFSNVNWSLFGPENYRLIDGNGVELASGTISGDFFGLSTVDLSSVGPVNKIGFQSGNDLVSAFNVAALSATAIPLPTAAWSGLGMLGLLGAGALRKKGLALLRA